ncbi:hypothetical protein NDU88_004446 [Pleurodeles waltl]|uniref:Uncharacterized protein n=1 Tax=Pleurodeles waltl TaxID=8319 RepID=A0AAV7LLC4_PLEWA|nr:hypothetical protein NDU88_004446 [Pleurodeles waltl]
MPVRRATLETDCEVERRRRRMGAVGVKRSAVAAVWELFCLLGAALHARLEREAACGEKCALRGLGITGRSEQTL